MQQILNGGVDDDDEMSKQSMRAHPDLIQSNLWQIPVPESSVGKTFEFLFNKLLDKKLVTMALYRLKGTKGNEYPYVYTNPKANTIISHRDRAFVLGIEFPHEENDFMAQSHKEGNLQSQKQGYSPDGHARNSLDNSILIGQTGPLSQGQKRGKHERHGSVSKGHNRGPSGGGNPYTSQETIQNQHKKVKLSMNDDRDEKIFGMTASKHQPNNV